MIRANERYIYENEKYCNALCITTTTSQQSMVMENKNNTSSFTVNFQAQFDINIEHWKHIFPPLIFLLVLFHFTYPPCACGVFVDSMWQNAYYNYNYECVCIFTRPRNEHRAQNCVMCFLLLFHSNIFHNDFGFTCLTFQLNSSVKIYFICVSFPFPSLFSFPLYCLYTPFSQWKTK